MKIVAIVQARMGSSRLPGKVLKPVLNEPLLKILLQRLKTVPQIDEIVIATTLNQKDQVIEDLSASLGYVCFRGSETDVLDRFYHAAMQATAGIVIRITADCPLVEPQLISSMLNKFHEHPVDYLSNTMPPRTFPRGLDAEIISMAALAEAWSSDKNPAYREHVTPYIYLNQEKFRCDGFYSSIDYSNFRWTVDTPEDYELITKIFNSFGHYHFNWSEVIKLMQDNPSWRTLNAHIEQKKVQ
jgi:spore coat polysaccharide biosynthesis protein SpsF